MRRRLVNFLTRLAVCGCVATALLPKAQGAGGDAVREKASVNKIDSVCIRHELKIWAIIEEHENKQLQATSMLVDVATLLDDAKSICARGDVQSAMTIYQSVLWQLIDHLRQLGVQFENERPE